MHLPARFRAVARRATSAARRVWAAKMPKSTILGEGQAAAAASEIERRSDKVERTVEESVRGVAKRASEENARGPRAKRTRTPERKGKKGERAFGAPL